MSPVKKSPAIPPHLVEALMQWYRAAARPLPWLLTRDPYAIWISEIMLQQTQVSTVEPYWRRWLEELPTVSDLADAPLDRLLKLWEGLGYYSRVRNAQATAQCVATDYQGIFPQQYDALIALPGIGPYTAGAICSIAFDQPRAVVDGNVIRVLARLFGIDLPIERPEARALFWKLAQEIVEAAARQGGERPCATINQALMELGALVCQPVPHCQWCPLRRHCVAQREDRARQLPRRRARPAMRRRAFAAFIVEKRGRFLVRRRARGGVNAGLWEFPNGELNGALPATAARALLGTRSRLKRWATIRHTITNNRIELAVFRVGPLNAPAIAGSGCWHTLERLFALPMPSAHRKIAQLLREELAGNSRQPDSRVQTHPANLATPP